MTNRTPNPSPAAGLPRRNLLLGGAALGVMGLGGGLLSSCSSESGSKAASGAAAKIQFDWLLNSAQTGEAVAIDKGWYKDAGLSVSLNAGGPNVQALGQVVGGRPLLGQMSSSDSLLVAASQGNPVRAIAAGLQQHPFAFFSLADTPLSTSADLVGKKVGVQPGDGQQLLTAALVKNGIDPASVEVVVVGGDLAPLLSHKIDAIAGWVTNAAQTSELGEGYHALRLWDMGIQLYANVYFAVEKNLDQKRDEIAAYLKATRDGWKFAKENPDQALEALFKHVPNLDKDAETLGLPRLLDAAFAELDGADAWGTMDEQVWQDQLDGMKAVDWFKDGTPPEISDVVDANLLG